MWWSKKDNDTYKKIFPDDRFDIIFERNKLTNRLVEWKRNRIWLGFTWMKDNLNQDDMITIKKSGSKVKFERK